MKILMIAPDNHMVDRRIIQEAKTLLNAGHDVTLISGFECPVPGTVVIDGVTVHRCRFPWTDIRYESFNARLGGMKPIIRPAWWVYRVINRLSGGPDKFEAWVRDIILGHHFDVLHVHDFPLLRIGVRAARIAGAAMYYDAHELYPAMGDLSRQRRRQFRRVEKRYIRQCTAVSTVNPYIADLMTEWYGIETPQVIMNAAERIDAVPSDMRKELGLPNDTILLLYQGWLAPNRQIDVMIRALGRLPDNLRLIIVGYGDYRAELEQIAREERVEKKVVFYGRVENSELAPVTAACDLGIIPYTAVDLLHQYCSPNKLFEFIMAGLPVLTNPLPFLKDVIDCHQCGIYGDLSTPDSMAKTIKTTLANAEMLSEFKKNAREARKHLNWDIEGKKLLKTYEKIERGLS